MKITEIIVGVVRIPYIKPFVTALRTIDSIEDVVLLIKTDNGLIGFGSGTASMAMTGESTVSIVHALAHVFSSHLLGSNVLNHNALLSHIDNLIPGNRAAKAAIDIALHDLFAQHCQLPLYQLLGGTRKEIRTGVSIGMSSAEEMASDAIRLIENGFNSIKLKAGGRGCIEEDIACVVAIRNAVGTSVNISVDANQAWVEREAITYLDGLARNGISIAMLEQPVKASNIHAMRTLKRLRRAVIYADESCFSPADALMISNKRAADGLVIKLMKAGGIKNASLIYSLASMHQIECAASCLAESPIGIGAMASFCSGRNMDYVDLDAMCMIGENPIQGGVGLSGNVITLTDTPGLGIKGVKNLQVVHTLTT